MHFVVYVILVLILIAVAFLLWKIRSFAILYADFPKYHVLIYLISAAVRGQIPPHIQFHGFFFQTLMKGAKQFQKEGMFFSYLLQPHLVIFGEEIVKVFSNEQTALNKSYKYDALRDIFGRGLLVSNDELWKKQRKFLNPAFHLGMLKSKLSIFNENADILVKNLSELKDCSCVDLLEYLKPYAFGGIFEYITDLKVNTQQDKDLVKNFAYIISKLGQMMVYRFGYPWYHYKFMMNFFPAGRKYLKHLEALHSFSRKMYATMKENYLLNEQNKLLAEDESEDGLQTRKSFAHILMEQHMKDPSFTEQDVQDQITTFMATGYDSSAFTALWCLFLLGHNPEVQEQVYNELETISEGPLNYEDLLKLTYMDCVIKETLRLYPAAPIYVRRCGKDIQIGKYKVPKNTCIVYFLYQLHRNPEIFPDPEKFYPERFLNKDIEKRPWSFTPFSEGIRYCIGKRFALMEVKVGLAHILRHFRVTSLDRRDDVDLCWEIVLTPAKPLRFKLSPRK